MALEVNLSQSRNIETQAARAIDTETLTVTRMVDSPEDQKVVVFLQELRQPVTLWEGATAYSTCGASNDGQWTDSDVDARLKEIFDV